MLRTLDLLELQVTGRISTTGDTKLSLSSLLFSGIPNQKDAGGAISYDNDATEGGKVTLTACEFEKCSSEETGGAIYCQSIDRLEVRSCTFRQCSTQGYGGAMHIEWSNLNVEGSLFDTCSSNSIGGAVAFQSEMAARAKYVTFQSNIFKSISGGKTKEDGGILSVLYASVESKFINNTFEACTVTSAQTGFLWSKVGEGNSKIEQCRFIDCRGFASRFCNLAGQATKSVEYSDCHFINIQGAIGGIAPTVRTTIDNCNFESCTGTTGIVVLPSIAGTEPHVVRDCNFTANVCDNVCQSLQVKCGDGSPMFTCTGCVFSEHRGELPFIAISNTGPSLPAELINCTFQDSDVGTGGVISYTAGTSRYYFERAVFRNIVSLADSIHILDFSGSQNIEMDQCSFEKCQISGYLVTLGGGSCSMSGCDFLNCETVYGVFRAASPVNEIIMNDCTMSQFTVFSAVGVLNTTQGTLKCTNCQLNYCENRLRGGPLFHLESTTCSFTGLMVVFKPSVRGNAIRIVNGMSTEFQSCAFALDDKGSGEIDAPLLQYSGAQNGNLHFYNCCFVHTADTIQLTGESVYLGVSGEGIVKFTRCCFDIVKNKAISSSISPEYDPSESEMFVECDTWCMADVPVVTTEVEPTGGETQPASEEIDSSSSSDSDEGGPDSGQTENNTPLGGIIGGLLAGLLLLILLILLILFLFVKRRRKESEPRSDERIELDEETVNTTNYEAKTDDYETSANPLFAQEVSEVEFLQGFEEVLPWNK